MKGKVLHEIWRDKSDLVVLLAMIALGFWLAPREWEQGLLVGLAIAGLIAFFGRAVRHAQSGR